MNTPADLVLVNGLVRTMDPDRESATAVAVADGLITAVGSDAEIRALCSPRTEVMDLHGACCTPGLVDGHAHIFQGARMTRGAELYGLGSLPEVLDRLRAEARDRGPEEWVLGWGLDYDVFEDSGLRTDVIDAAVGGRPAVLTFRDGHTALASTRALQSAGIDGPRTFTEHAEVVCVDGVPTGELREDAAMQLVKQAVPELTEDELYRAYVDNLRRFAAVGITGVHMMDGGFAWLELLATLESRGDLITRVLAAFTIEPDTPEQMWEVYAACGGAHGRRWRAGVAKFFIDGVVESGTAWLTEPDSQGAGVDAFWPDTDRYEQAVRLFAEHGFQCVTHAIGDMGVRFALDTYERAGAAPGVRHRIEHIELLQPSDLARFAALGVIASPQPEHMFGLRLDRSDVFSQRVGADRCGRAFRVRELVESGAVVAFGSDWPVRSQDPRRGMATARLRRWPGAPELKAYDDQAVDGLQALHGYTRGPAIAGGDGHRLGLVRPGFCADLTVFEADPVTCDPDDLIALPVLATIVDGECMFRAADAPL